MSPPESPADWLRYLYGKLTQQRPELDGYVEYYDGEHQRLAFAQMRYRHEFREVFETWRDNFCGLIVDSCTERMHVEAFRLAESPGTDDQARHIWQRNRMDALSGAVHLDSLVQGVAYVLVWPDEKTSEPKISPIEARNLAVEYRRGSITEIEAAAHFHVDSWGRHWATLWTPEYVYETRPGQSWEEGTRGPNPLDIVPIVPFRNRLRLSGVDRSELSDVIPIQDAVNKVISDALMASETAAFPQKFVSGLEITEDENGNPVEPFQVAVDKLLQAEDPQARFGSFAAADLANWVTLISMLVQHLASISRTPPTYFLANGTTFPSGESILSAEAGLVAKVKERLRGFGESWEQVIRLCFAIKHDKRQHAYDMETVWRDPEYRTEAQHIDALLKLHQLDVPLPQLWADAGYSDAQIATFREWRKEDARAAAELQHIGPKPETGGGFGATPQPKTARQMASKPPQGNSGNVNRKLNEDS
ncbi:phage portal protein [Streptomyces buecherae]|uniref:phage portal protein n=1 Tax=Streptomyces buecherae TaxID=2763006 RepID=UPI00164CE478|nr:phage portal protein [Streptomyces buecherae]QNJ42027.1 phage portal protein [Streptomyces buecherae]